MNFQSSESNALHKEEVSISQFTPPPDNLAYIKYVKPEIQAPKRIVLLHGFTQNALSFHSIALELAIRFDVEVISVDLPGHGKSGHVLANLDKASEMLSPFGLESLWVGYSLGARHLLTLCLKYPEIMWNVIFSGLNPGIEDIENRNERYAKDLVIAERLKSIENNDLEFNKFLNEWMTQPIFLPREIHTEDLDNRMTNKPNALASSLILASVGTQPNYWPELENLKGKITFITGGEDKKYLAATEKIPFFLRGQTTIKRLTIKDHGHAAIFDKSETLISAITEHLAL